MKKSIRLTHHRDARGFSLIITISLMVLLSLVAVGVLSLSSIVMRSASHDSDMAEARANARLALAMALGELQKHAGPDARITASGEVMGGSTAHPHIAGVWESVQQDPSSRPDSSDFSKTGKADQFLRWMVSHSDPTSVEQQSFVDSAFPAGESVTLLGENTLGSAANTSDYVSAGRVPVSNGDNTPRGTYAYAVLDENVKAKLNQGYRDPSGEIGLTSTQLGGASRAAIESTDAFSSLSEDSFDLDNEGTESDLAKYTSLKSAELALDKLGSDGSNLSRYLHDFTTESSGVLANTADGGLKLDLSTLFDQESLPATISGKGIYETVFGLDEPSDPMWALFHDYSRIYRDRIEDNGGTPMVEASIPTGWKAGTLVSGSDSNTHTALLSPPNGAVIVPSIAKVQLIFSLTARDIYTYSSRGRPPGVKSQEESSQLHSPWGKRFAGSDYDYLLHLIYTPVVTLHNPYNVAIEFSSVRLDFVNVPLSLQIYRNGEPQMTQLVPFGRMYLPVDQGKRTAEKEFSMTLAPSNGVRGPSAGAPVTLLPGETQVFSPYLASNLTWASEFSGTRSFTDWSDGSVSGHADTASLVAVPGWMGEGIGFDLDWFAPAEFRASSVEVDNGVSMDRGGCIALKSTDNIAVEFAPIADKVANSRFSVAMHLQNERGSGTSNTPATVLEFDYQELEGLHSELLDGENMRYPRDGAEINTLDMFEHSSTALSNYVKTKPFAVFSAYGKTTAGGVEGEEIEGRYAVKPWSFNNPTSPVVSQQVLNEHPSHHSHELDIYGFEGAADSMDNYLEIDSNNRGNYITGHTSYNGIKFGTHFELPLAPLQSLTSLNSSNPLASGHLPRFDFPIGNSFGHPIMNSSEIIEPGQNTENPYNLLDHSYLLNLALFDRTYFSTLAERTGPYLDGMTVQDQVENFFNGENTTLEQRTTPHLPEGTTQEEAVDLLSNSSADTAWMTAAFQMLDGSFNVNSTSVAAWKAMLSALRADNAQVFDALQESFTDLQTADGATFSRFRLPNAQEFDQADDSTTAYWQGTIQITDDELDQLATAIVQQVQERGPFLSMGEFLNRQLGSASDETIKGALQAAIDETGINSDHPGSGGQITEDQISDYQFATPEAAVGFSGQGAPGYLTQADLMNVLGNAATVRSDTFRIRTYGDARDRSGKVLATAWCEAVVQRIPDYVDPSDDPWAIPSNDSSRTLDSPAQKMASSSAVPEITQEVNNQFGRRFTVKSFRWLSADEI